MNSRTETIAVIVLVLNFLALFILVAVLMADPASAAEAWMCEGIPTAAEYVECTNGR